MKNTINKIVPLLLAIIFMMSNQTNAEGFDFIQNLLSNGKYSVAEKQYIQNLESNKTAVNYYFAGKISLILHKTTEAKNFFEAGANLDKDNLLNNVGLGAIALSQGDTSKTHKIFNEIIEKDEFNTIELVLEMADAYFYNSKTDFNYIISLVNKAAAKKEHAKNPNLFLKLGLLYSLSGNSSIALEQFKKSNYLDKSFIQPYVEIAKIYNKIKDYQSVQSFLSNALAIDSTFAPIYSVYSDYYSDTKQYEQAVKSYNLYITLSEKSLDKTYTLSTLYFLSKDYFETIKLINELTNTDLFDNQMRHILAYSYYFVEDKENGIAAFKLYLDKADKNNVTATDYEYYASLNAKAGYDSTAIANYKTCITLDSTKNSLYGDIASIYFKLKKWNEAASNYEIKLNKLGKLQLKEYFDLARCYMISKKYTLADSIYSDVINLKPDFPLGYLMKARAKSSIDTTSELGYAKSSYEKFIELSTASSSVEKYKNDLVEAYSYLGYFYYLKKDDPEYKDTWMQGFKTNWNKVLELDPNNIQAKEALKTIK